MERLECKKALQEIMVRKLLFTVKDIFEIPQRGVVLTPGYLINVDRLEEGDSIKLVRPDGIELTSQVKGKELPNYPSDFPQEKWRAGIMLTGLSQHDVPIGTEVWSI